MYLFIKIQILFNMQVSLSNDTNQTAISFAHQSPNEQKNEQKNEQTTFNIVPEPLDEILRIDSKIPQLGQLDPNLASRDVKSAIFCRHSDLIGRSCAGNKCSDSMYGGPCSPDCGCSEPDGIAPIDKRPVMRMTFPTKQ
jgi:hypothetical protein